jgi:predicted molibdopterin-dependent oxidoreductase YjgC
MVKKHLLASEYYDRLISGFKIICLLCWKDNGSLENNDQKTQVFVSKITCSRTTREVSDSQENPFILITLTNTPTCFKHVRISREKRILPLSCQSVCPSEGRHVSARFTLGGLP